MPVAAQLDHRAQHPVLEDVGAVADEIAGPGKLRAVLLDRAPVHRQRRRVGQQLQEVGRDPGQSDFQVPITERVDAERIDGEIAGNDRRDILYHRQCFRVVRRRLGIDETPQAEHEVVCRHRVPVGPARLLAEEKFVAQPVVGNRPALGHAGHQRAVGCVAQQAFEQIPLHRVRLRRPCQMRIDRFGFLPEAALERRFDRTRRLRAAVAGTDAGRDRQQSQHG